MIGIFDSGIGGVTVLKEILKTSPNYHFIYYSDSLHNPYGNLNDKELYKIVSNIVKLLIEKGCKIIVIACNTASCKCAKLLRSKYKNISFIAIEPAYKMVHDYNPSGKTLVMATKGTIESEKFIKLKNKYDNHKTILKPCIGLAELIENDRELEIEEYLRKEIKTYKGVENVVLGCTHYPLIKNKITNILGPVKYFDGSSGVSKQLKKIIKEKNIKAREYFLEFIDSSNNEYKEENFYKILRGEK